MLYYKILLYRICLINKAMSSATAIPFDENQMFLYYFVYVTYFVYETYFVYDTNDML
jgi:hypothetical protein